MNAAIDFGNTRIKIGFFEEEKLVKVFRSSEIREVLETLEKNKIEYSIVSSVTKTAEELNEALKVLKNKIILSHTTPLPITNKYATPSTLGYDRIAAAVAANMYFPTKNCLIIDLGTAIKYDFINSRAEFIGGIISPGRSMRFKALHTFTQKLPLLNQTDIPLLIGTSTETCMASGVINGIMAEINGIIEQYLKNHPLLEIIICGGDAGYFESQIKYPTFAAPNLVLEGLNRILYHNVKNT
jgi:type III pantothenate kinase